MRGFLVSGMISAAFVVLKNIDMWGYKDIRQNWNTYFTDF